MHPNHFYCYSSSNILVKAKPISIGQSEKEEKNRFIHFIEYFVSNFSFNLPIKYSPMNFYRLDQLKSIPKNVHLIHDASFPSALQYFDLDLV